MVAAVKTNIREMDFLARFAADEFILCLSGMTTEETEAALGGIRDTISRKVTGRGDAAIAVTIGALTLASGQALGEKLQDILAALGKSLVDARNRKTDAVVIAEM